MKYFLAMAFALMVSAGCSTHYIYLENSVYHDPTPPHSTGAGQVSVGLGSQAQIPIASPSALSNESIITCPDASKNSEGCGGGGVTPIRFDAKVSVYRDLQLYRHPDTFGVQYQLLGDDMSAHMISVRYGWGGLNQSHGNSVTIGNTPNTEYSSSKVSLNEYSLSYGYTIDHTHTFIAQANFVEVYTRYDITSGGATSRYSDKGFHSRFGPAYRFAFSYFYIWTELTAGITKMSYLKKYNDGALSVAFGYNW